MQKSTILLLVVVLASTAFAASFRDNFDLLEEEIESYHGDMKTKLGELDGESMSRAYKESFKKIMQESKWACLNGADPSKLTNQQYLKAFAAGPCNPAVYLPGISGSKLSVVVNCNEFKQYHPDDFKSCGWQTCTGFLSPKSEYRVWAPHVLSPMSIGIPDANHRNCFSAVFGFDTSKAAQGILTQKRGLKVMVEGTTPETRTFAKSKCASKSVENLGLEDFAPRMYLDLRLVFENAGYKCGVNLQALPYDFRLAYQENELNARFPGVIQEMYTNLGKKVVVIAHSFGNH